MCGNKTTAGNGRDVVDAVFDIMSGRIRIQASVINYCGGPRELWNIAKN